MPQNEPLTLTPTQTAEQPEISPAVAEIMERAHSGAVLRLEQFEANQESPFRHYLEEANGMIRGIMNIPPTGQELSEIVTNRIEYKKRMAANEERFRNAA